VNREALGVVCNGWLMVIEEDRGRTGSVIRQDS
jgi:hypothetical protein